MKCLDRDWLQEYSLELVRALVKMSQECRSQLFIAGGPVRDWLLGHVSRDLDITVPNKALSCAEYLAREIGGAFVPLDAEEGVARVVWQDHAIDFSAFRDDTLSIEDDLKKRDFTMNALAISFDPEQPGLEQSLQIIDPTGGVSDLEQGVIRATSKSVFANDPLRMLRAYRFSAVFNFVLEQETEGYIRENVALLDRVSPERISYELDRIMESSRAHAAFAKIAEAGLLWVIFPELKSGVGQDQPGSHHLDVFSHSLATLNCMERLLREPGEFFPSHGRFLKSYCAQGKRSVWLKWASLFHDLGKPDTFKMRGERITFYNHDQAGGAKFYEISQRLRWSKEDSKQASRFIALHMWPFHLNNAMRKTGITARACLKLVKAIGAELPGLFLLAMADSLAGQGPAKPSGMEKSLAELYARVDEVYRQNIQPVLEQPRLLSGNDLISIFRLTPGPRFREILDGLQKDQVEGNVSSRDEALSWVKKFLRENEGEHA